VLGSQGWCFHSNLFYGNGGAKFRKEEWQRIGNQIDARVYLCAGALRKRVVNSGIAFGLFSFET